MPIIMIEYSVIKPHTANLSTQLFKLIPGESFWLLYTHIISTCAMNFRTKKCNHGDKGRCINCLTQQIRTESKQQLENSDRKITCNHRPNMKCLKCMDSGGISKQPDQCTHPDYEKCPKCAYNQTHDTFKQYLERMAFECKHNKPCMKCIPPLNRKTYMIDKTCRKHLPYPQAQCDACMAPTISIAKQSYAHIKCVVIRTISVYKILETDRFGVLLGSISDGVAYIDEVYFPRSSEKIPYFASPEILLDYQQLFDALGYTQVGLLYACPELTGRDLLSSAVFQDFTCLVDPDGNQINQFITMRLSNHDFEQQFECYMVSDQFQSLRRNYLIFEKEGEKDYFDLITAKNDRDSSSPTFLRAGIETDEIYFREIIVWLSTVSEQNFLLQDPNLSYPFFTVQSQTIENIQALMNVEVREPLDKYRNVQFLLHLYHQFGKQVALIFVSVYIYQDPDRFLQQQLQHYHYKQLKKYSRRNPRAMQ